MTTNELVRLRNRVDELEALIGLNEHIPAEMPGARLHKKQVRAIINLLLRREMCSKEAIGLAVELKDDASANTVSVYVCSARKALRSVGVDLRLVWGGGWYVATADKPKLRAALGRPQQ